jgi:hypothetical protein
MTISCNSVDACGAFLSCSLVASCANYTEQELKDGAVQIKTTIRHKYAQDVLVSIKFEMGGEPAHIPWQPIFLLLIR